MKYISLSTSILSLTENLNIFILEIQNSLKFTSILNVIKPYLSMLLTCMISSLAKLISHLISSIVSYVAFMTLTILSSGTLFSILAITLIAFFSLLWYSDLFKVLNFSRAIAISLWAFFPHQSDSLLFLKITWKTSFNIVAT